MAGLCGVSSWKNPSCYIAAVNDSTNKYIGGITRSLTFNPKQKGKKRKGKRNNKTKLLFFRNSKVMKTIWRENLQSRLLITVNSKNKTPSFYFPRQPSLMRTKIFVSMRSIFATNILLYFLHQYFPYQPKQYNEGKILIFFSLFSSNWQNQTHCK